MRNCGEAETGERERPTCAPLPSSFVVSCLCRRRVNESRFLSRIAAAEDSPSLRSLPPLRSPHPTSATAHDNKFTKGKGFFSQSLWENVGLHNKGAKKGFPVLLHTHLYGVDRRGRRLREVLSTCAPLSPISLLLLLRSVCINVTGGSLAAGSLEGVVPHRAALPNPGERPRLPSPLSHTHIESLSSQRLQSIRLFLVYNKDNLPR